MATDEQRGADAQALALYNRLMDVVIADASARAEQGENRTGPEAALSALVCVLVDVARAAGTSISEVIENLGRASGIVVHVREVPIEPSRGEV